MEFDEAVSSFRMALNAPGDPACFFFSDIISLLIKQQNVTFQLNELYTDYGITDKAKKELLALNDHSLISAFQTYLEAHE